MTEEAATTETATTETAAEGAGAATAETTKTTKTTTEGSATSTSKGSDTQTSDGPYRPEGLPETMYGKDDRETIDKMAKSLHGFRNKANQSGAPKTADEYSLGEVPDTIQPYLSNLEDDEVFASVKAAAHKFGISNDQFGGFVTTIVQEMYDGGLLSEVIDADAERKALIPDSAQYLSPAEQTLAINARMNDNFAWLDNVGPLKGIPSEMGEFIKASMGDSATGHQVIEKMRAMSDTSAVPLMGGATGADAERSLAARETDPRNDTFSPKYDSAFRAETDRLSKELFAAKYQA